MNQSVLLFVIFTVYFCGNVYGKIYYNEDKPYDVIHIKVPTNVWKQAFQPTPVLKSTATVVVPIHINQEYLDSEYEDEIIDDELEAANQTLTEEITTVIPLTQLDVTNQTIDTVDNTTAVLQDEDNTIENNQQVIGQGIRFPCSCVGGQCGCCTAMNLPWFKSSACGNITFVPEDFVFDVRLSINNNTVVRQRVSASDPPPICFNPRRVPFIRVCLEISNIRIRNRNAFACLDITADIAEFPVYTASFRCFGLGASGVQAGLKPKPVSSGPAPVSLFGAGGDDDDRGSFIENAAGAVLGGTSNGDGLFGGANGGLLFGGDSEDDGPLDVIGDAIGDFFGGRQMEDV